VKVVFCISLLQASIIEFLGLGSAMNVSRRLISTWLYYQNVSPFDNSVEVRNVSHFDNNVEVRNFSPLDNSVEVSCICLFIF